MVNERIRPTGYRVSSKLIKHGRERSVQIRARNALINMEIYSKIWCARAYFRGVSCVKVTRNDFSNGDAIATSVAFFSRALSCYRMRAIRFHKDAGTSSQPEFRDFRSRRSWIGSRGNAPRIGDDFVD